jgi:Do/DeqQ family serine protease
MIKILLSITSVAFVIYGFGIAKAETLPTSRQEISLSFAPVVKQVAPAVVNIYTKRTVTRNISPFMNDPLFAQLFGGMGFPQQRLEGSLGTGVILDSAGIAVTNAHVIRNADEISVVLSDGREFPAKLVLQDEASDLALLRIDSGEENLPYARLQSSESSEVGDLVIAIGNPFGVGQTVTSGIISALARSSMNINDYNFFIQTDAAINPGNSGGPLVSMSGGVIGINTAIFSKDGGSLGIGFAIPSEMVTTILAAEKSGQISKSGDIVRPWIGITAQDVTSDIAHSLDLSTPSGALIADIHTASPALTSGIKVGDIITSINNYKIKDAAELRFRLATLALGETAKIEVKRGDKTIETQITSISPPDSPPRDGLTISGDNPLNGATLSNLNPAVEVELGLKNSPDKGVVVTAINPRTMSARVLRVGDIIVAVNGSRVSSPRDVEKAIEKPTRQGWIVKVITGGQERTLMIR